MGAYKRHYVAALSKKAACGRRKANIITTVRIGEVTCSLCLRAIAPPVVSGSIDIGVPDAQDDVLAFVAVAQVEAQR